MAPHAEASRAVRAGLPLTARHRTRANCLLPPRSLLSRNHSVRTGLPLTARHRTRAYLPTVSQWPTKKEWMLSAGCSPLKSEGFSCCLDVFYGGLGIVNSNFWSKKDIFFYYIFQIFGHQNPGFGSDSLIMLDSDPYPDLDSRNPDPRHWLKQQLSVLKLCVNISQFTLCTTSLNNGSTSSQPLQYEQIPLHILSLLWILYESEAQN